jgi:type IV pilus assembly protein PilW
MNRRARGFSLIELMVSVTLGLIVLAILATIFANASTARTELQRSSQQMDNGRYAVDVLTQDLQLAGYFGELNVGGLVVPPALPDVCSTVPADWIAAMPFHLQGYDDGAAAPACMPASLKAASDIVAVRRVRTCVAGAAGCEALIPTQPYLQVGLCGSSGNEYALGLAQDTAFPYKLKDCATAAGKRRYTVNIYFVSTDNGSGAAIPTLKRLEFNGAGYTEVPLVEGIERLEIEYGLDIDGDGSPDAYAADPTTYTYAGCTSCSASNNWANVVTAKLHVLSRSLEPAARGYIDNKVYDLGTNAAGERVTAGPFGDAYRRQVYTAAVRIMNLSGRRDTP